MLSTIEHTSKNILPLELVEIILDFLCCDPKSLKAASLVSRAWVSFCRKHLFHRIVLHWCNDGLRRSNLLYALITQTPHIAKYIHELSIHEGLVHSEHSPNTTLCFAQNPSLPKLLCLLPQLHLIEFRASTLTPWCELSPELLHALLHVISTSPALDGVMFRSWSFAAQPRALEALLTVGIENVKSLALTDIVTPPFVIPEDHRSFITGTTHIAQHGPGNPRQLVLQSLIINDRRTSSLPYYTRWLRSSPNGIKHLQLSCATNEMCISEFLSVLGESLEYLELDIRTVFCNGPVDLYHNTRLRALELRVSEHPLVSLRSNISVIWLVDTLSTLRSFDCLELIQIGFGIDTERLRRLSQSDATHWHHLGQILCPKRYHRLSSVQIGIQFEIYDDLEYVKEARECMTNLVAAGILDIHSETRQFHCVDYR